MIKKHIGNTQLAPLPKVETKEQWLERNDFNKGAQIMYFLIWFALGIGMYFVSLALYNNYHWMGYIFGISFIILFIFMTLHIFIVQRKEYNQVKTMDHDQYIQHCQPEYYKAFNARHEEKLRLAKVMNILKNDIPTQVANFNLIRDGYIWVGMPERLIAMSIGRARHVESNVRNSVEYKKLFFEPYQTERGLTKYNLRIDLKAGIVTGWT